MMPLPALPPKCCCFHCCCHCCCLTHTQVLASYPLDFTFVCPTELTAFSDRHAEFKALNTEVLCFSVDSQFSHLAWIQTDRKEGECFDDTHAKLHVWGCVLLPFVGVLVYVGCRSSLSLWVAATLGLCASGVAGWHTCAPSEPLCGPMSCWACSNLVQKFSGCDPCSAMCAVRQHQHILGAMQRWDMHTKQHIPSTRLLRSQRVFTRCPVVLQWRSQCMQCVSRVCLSISQHAAVVLLHACATLMHCSYARTCMNLPLQVVLVTWPTPWWLTSRRRSARHTAS
jgi:hypothetical protein